MLNIMDSIRLEGESLIEPLDADLLDFFEFLIMRKFTTLKKVKYTEVFEFFNPDYLIQEKTVHDKKPDLIEAEEKDNPTKSEVSSDLMGLEPEAIECLCHF